MPEFIGSIATQFAPPPSGPLVVQRLTPANADEAHRTAIAVSPVIRQHRSWIVRILLLSETVETCKRPHASTSKKAAFALGRRRMGLAVGIAAPTSCRR